MTEIWERKWSKKVTEKYREGMSWESRKESREIEFRGS